VLWASSWTRASGATTMRSARSSRDVCK
jgi:hypothetical protein